MKQAKSFLDSLLGSVDEFRCIPARATWVMASQAPSCGTDATGAVLRVLMPSGGRWQARGAACTPATIDSVAGRAWADWQAASGADAVCSFAVGPHFAERLLQAMVAAARADGHVTPAERVRIDRSLARMGLDAEAQALIAAELDSPLDVGRIASLARNEAEATELYAASLLVVDPEGPAEKAYLDRLAARLGLDAGLVLHIHARAAALV